MKRLILGVGIGIVFLSALLGAKSQTLTVDEAVKTALKHSPNINISRLDFKGAQQRTRFQEGFYLPRLDLGATAGRQGAKIPDQDHLSSNAIVGWLSASQLLYDFGKTSAGIDAAGEEAKAYEAQMYQTVSDKILSVKANYYEVLKAKSIIHVAQENIELQKNQLRRAMRFYESGIRTIIDVSDARVRLTQAKLDLNNAEYDLKLRRAVLEQTMGYIPYNGNYRLYHKKLALPDVSQHLPRVRTPLAQLEGFAYDHRYVLKSSDYLAQSSNSRVKSEEGDYYPRLSLEGDYQAQNFEEDIFGLTPDRQWQAGVKMQWNLFAGFQTDASVQEAKISAMKAASQMQDVRLLIKRQVIEAYLGVRRTKDAVVLSESVAKASKKKHLQAQKRYENDLSDYIELQDAQQGYIESLSELVHAYYNYYIALARLDHAVGR